MSEISAVTTDAKSARAEFLAGFGRPSAVDFSFMLCVTPI